ncbi:MAG: enoyl-CoA hydratase [Pseudomonadota bacterium]|uniref:Enoyl-CoA hydratase domain-containing protein 3, mitochondrial n=1 Tax=Candidatus Desulfatibia profunda TaxID=2841695 RepID=A0A8J6NZY8_9BACT|nr:enoyl-CoA hydratase [Candidatus Desulfatibia profunda]MBL7179801.1 enoyl-CoA hydratase [Desulfobacterales bacterium]
MEPVLLEKDGPIGWLTLNRPEKRNALSLELMHAMQNKLDHCAKDVDIRTVVIRGNGPAFCAGHDLNEMAGDHYDARHFRKIFSICADLMQILHQLPQPVIAQVHGIATAAGCQLVAACDLAIAESGARFATPGVKIGLFCSTPAIPLVRVIGRRRAMEMLLTGRFVSAQEAERFGLVNHVVAADKLAEETRNWAMEMAQYSRFTLAYGKQAFYNQIDLNEPAAYNYATDAMVVNCLAADAQEGMTAFLKKRQAVWKHK